MRNLHRERTLYQEAIELSVRACRLAESCGEVGVVRLGSQLSRAAVLVPTLIARSYAPLTGDALSEHLDRVESALLELETLLVLSVRLGRVSQPEAAAVLANLDGVRVELWLEQQRAEVAREEQAPALTVPDPVEPAGRRAPAAPVAASLPEPPAPAPESAPTRAQAVPILPEPGPAPSEAPPQAPVGASARPARAPEPAASSAPAILTPEPLPSPPPVPASPLAAHRVGPEPTQAGPPTSTPARPTEPPAAHPESPPPRSVPPKTLLPSSASARPAPRENTPPPPTPARAALPPTEAPPRPRPRPTTPPVERLVLDGCNFLGCAPGYMLGSEESRETLIRRLQDYAHRHPAHRIVAFFDSTRATRTANGNVEQRSTSGSRPADDVMLDFLQQLEPQDQRCATLVTNDRELSRRARNLGVRVEDVKWLAEQLQAAGPTSGAGPKERGLSRSEVTAWEQFFNEGPHRPGRK